MDTTQQETPKTNGNGKTAATGITIVRPKAKRDWGVFIENARLQHYRRLELTIQLREKLHAGKPAQLNAAEAMIRARGLEASIEAVNVDDPVELATAAAEAADGGLCEFHRIEGKTGIYWPTNNFKACIKENWGVLGYRLDARPKDDRKGTKTLRGSRGALAEGLFVFSADPANADYIHLGDAPDGMDTSVTHAITPQGPRSSIKRNEYVMGRKMVFHIHIAKAVAEKIPDESFADMLVHASDHGIGANRSQGQGKFDIISLEDI